MSSTPVVQLSVFLTAFIIGAIGLAGLLASGAMYLTLLPLDADMISSFGPQNTGMLFALVITLGMGFSLMAGFGVFFALRSLKIDDAAIAQR